MVELGDARDVQEKSFFGFENDSISLDLRNFHQQQRNDQKLKSVFFSFENLHRLMNPSEIIIANDGNYRPNYRLNSRVVSLTFDHGRLNLVENDSRRKLKKSPVTVRLNRLRQNTDKPDVCAFWSESSLSWSEEGCKLISSDATTSVCACDHLTAFALLSPVESVSGVSDLSGQVSVVKKSSGLSLDIIVYLVASICLIIIIVVIFQVSQTTFNFLTASSQPQNNGTMFVLLCRRLF